MGYSIVASWDYAKHRPMRVEQKLLLCVLLQALAERDPRYVVTYSHKRSTPVALVKRRLSEEAREFVDSGEFEEMAREVGVDADFLRKGSPDQAQQAYVFMHNPDTNFDEAVARVLGVQDQGSEPQAEAA